VKPLSLFLALALVGPRIFGQADDDAYHQALLNYKAGNYGAARLAIDDAEKANPSNLGVAVLKSRILAEQGDFKDGEALLRKFLGPDGPFDIQLALGDVLLRKRDFGGAANMYDQALQAKPGDVDVKLKLVYAKINAGDLVTAAKYSSEMKPLDPVNPAYYFAKAALAQGTGKDTEADQNIETSRTIYGITTTNRYLKTYLQVFAHAHASEVNDRAAPPSTNAAPAKPSP
jgi:tetratricopeptide (TPR) repeat protein